MKLVKEIRVLAKLGKIIDFIRNYPQIVWNNINSNGLTIQYSFSNKIWTTYLNGLWSLVFAVLVGTGLGLVLGAFISFCIAVALYLEYQFVFRKYHRNGTWANFLEYKRAPKEYVIPTRGGNIKITDLFEAIDDSSNYFKPILENVIQTCFTKVGLYRIGEYLRPAIERLKKVGLARWVKVGGKMVQIVNLDVLLIIALEQSSLTLFTTDLFNVQVAIHEFSRMKLLFNLILIFSTSTLVLSASAFAVLSIVLNNLGFAETTLLTIRMAQISLGTALTSGLSYVGGQFIPPVNCLPFGEYIEPSRADDEPPIGFTGDTVYAYNPPDISEDYVRFSKHMPDPDFSNKLETEVSDLPTLGSLDSQESGPAPGHGSLRGSNKPATKSYSDLARENSPQFEEAEIIPKRQQPVYQKLKEEIQNLENDQLL